MERHGTMIKVRPEKLEEYKRLHANPWPEVNKAIKDAHLGNYSIFYRDGYLFTFVEYTGADYEADMKKMGENEAVQKWLKLTDPCQEALETAAPGEWWAPMEEVFRLE